MGKANPQNESEFRQQIFDAVGHVGHFCQIESHDVSLGFPDVEYCIRGKSNQMELKFHDGNCLPKNFIRPSQVRWFRKRIKVKGHPWLFALFLVGGTRYYMIFDDVEQISQINNVGVWQIHARQTWMDKMNWHELINIIS